MKVAADKKQLGQTLIETLVAIFILVVGLISALALAISSFQSTDSAGRQIVATALARQGVEAVKNIRDSNWLNGSLADCSATMTAGQFCFTNWLGTAATSLAAGTYAVKFNSSTGVDPWTMQANPASFALNYNPATGIYDIGGVGAPSIYSRKVVIVQNAVAPFSAANPQLDIVSTVWWRDRRCPATTDPTTLAASCKVILEMHLTNWRNYN